VGARAIDQKKIEPNSDLGQAIRYMLKRWGKLTLFLREAGALWTTMPPNESSSGPSVIGVTRSSIRMNEAR